MRRTPLERPAESPERLERLELLERPERLEGAPYRTRSGELLTVRHCQGFAEFDACVDLQKQTWGYPDDELTPRKAFLLARELGGQVIGAFGADPSGGERLVAFAMAMAALDSGGPYLHSHMLAVLPPYRDSGIGRRLKLVQREDALERGITRMTWTFDPLAAKNAYFNLHRLGAIARRYSPDFYGVSSSRLQAGLPSDRLHAEWWLQSSRVVARIGAMAAKPLSPIEELRQQESEQWVEQTIVLPKEADRWKQSADTLNLALEVQRANRLLFQDAFSQGLALVDFARDEQGNGLYKLIPWSAAQASD